MKITLDRNAFIKRLQTLHAILIDKPIIPITGSVLISFDGLKMNMRSTNTRTTVKLFMAVENMEGKAIDFVADTRTIANVISKLNSEQVYIEIQKGSIFFGVEGGRRKVYEIPIEYNASDFPAMLDVKDEFSFKLNGPNLYDTISKTTKFVVKDDLRMPEGFVFGIKEGKLCVATMGNIQFTETRIETDSNMMGNAIVYASFSNVVETFKSSAEVTMTFSDDNKHTTFSDGAVTVQIRNEDKTVPDYRKIIDSINTTSEVIVDRVELISAINRTSALLKDNDLLGVSLEFSKTDVTVKCSDSNFKTSGEEVIALSSNKDAELEIGLNYKQAVKALSSLNGDMIVIKMGKEDGLVVMDEIDKSGYGITVYMAPYRISK